jgi:hypothetical protein
VRKETVPRRSSRSTNLPAREHLVDDPLVIFHRRALRDRQGNDSRPRRGETIHPQHSLRNADLEGRVLRDEVILAHDLSCQLGYVAAQPRKLAFAPIGRHVMSHQGAERVDV